MIKKTVNLFVLFLLLSSIFVIAQETDSEETVVEECKVGCKIWQFLFGSKEARAGRAWFDRSEALAGEAISQEVKEVSKKTNGAQTITKEDVAQKTVAKVVEQIVSEKIEQEPVVVKLPEVLIGETVEKKVVPTTTTAPSLPSKLQKDHGAIEGFKSILGEKDYALYERAIGGADEIVKGEDRYVMRKYDQKDQVVGLVRIVEDPQTGLWVGEVSGKVGRSDGLVEKENFVAQNGHVLATQAKPGDPIKVRDTSGKLNSYKVSKDIALEKDIASEEGIFFEIEDNKKGGRVQFKEGQLTVTNFEEETQEYFNPSSGEGGRLNIDYYKGGEGECDRSEGCSVPTGGKVTLLGADGKLREYSADYDYQKSGAERVEENPEIELYGPRGNREGVRKPDGTEIIALRDENGKYTGQQSVKIGEASIIAEKDNDVWVSTETGVRFRTAVEDVEKKDQAYQTAVGKLTAAEATQVLDALAVSRGEKRRQEVDLEPVLNARAEVEKAEKELKEAKKEVGEALEAEAELINKLNTAEVRDALENNYDTTKGGLAIVQTVLESIYAVTSQIKSYPALSNLILGEVAKDWRTEMDKAFAPALGVNYFVSAICEGRADGGWMDIEPEGKAVIKTVSGTYQAVASIQMESSPETSPILCHRNPDQEAEEQWICDRGQICVDESFCYADKDRDDEPDDDKPLLGYFYKVTWSVTSPQDEAFTPLVDENGVAVSFNIFLNPGAIPLYNLDGNFASPIQLKNGASDRDAIVKFSDKIYNQACIVWNQPPSTLATPGRDSGPLENVCFDRYDDEGNEIDGFISKIGQVNWERSGKEAASVTVSHGQVSRNTDW